LSYIPSFWEVQPLAGPPAITPSPFRGYEVSAGLREICFDYVMDYGASEGRAHDSPVYHVKSLSNGWHGWCI